MHLFFLLCACITIWTCNNSHASGVEKTSQVSADCVLLIDDEKRKIDEVAGLLKMDTVHMIDIQLFSGPSFTEPFFPQFQMTLVDEWGREVISVLDFKHFIVTFTLSVGHERFDLHINESYKGCMKAKKNTMDFIVGSLLKLLTAKLPRTSSQICYVNTHFATLSQVNRICCKMIQNYGSNYRCDKDQHGTFDVLSLPHFRTCFVLGTFIFIFIIFFTLIPEHDVHVSQEKLNKYYLVPENTTSIRYSLRSIIWGEYEDGEIVSMIRGLVVFALSCIGYIFVFRPFYPETWLDVIFGIWVALFCFFPSSVVNLPIPCDHHLTPKWLVWPLKKFFKYDVRGIAECHHTGCVGILKLICLPFDIERWKEALKKITKNFEEKNTEAKPEESNLNAKISHYCCSLILRLVCLIYILVVFIVIIFVIIVSLLAKPYMYLKNMECTVQNFARIIYFLLIQSTSRILMTTTMLLCWLPFFSGLLCNFTHYIPYITVVLVSFYYLLQFWKSFNNKYFALKMFIYNEYQKRESMGQLKLAAAEKELKFADRMKNYTEKTKKKIEKKLEKVVEDAEKDKDKAKDEDEAKNKKQDATKNERGAMGNELSSLDTFVEEIQIDEFTKKSNNFNLKIKAFFRDIIALVEEYKKHTASLLNLDEANVELTNANVKRVKANVGLANDEEKRRVDANVEDCKKRIQNAKEEKKKAKESVERANNDLETAKQETNNEMKQLEDEVKKSEKENSEKIIELKNARALSLKKGISSSKKVKKMENEIEELKRQLNNVKSKYKKERERLKKAKKLCDTLNDLSKTISAAENDQPATEYFMLHLSLSQKWRIVPVISRTIYHKIQKRILPYHINLFVPLSKSLFLVLFTYFCIEFIKKRQESNFTDIVKVLTTMSVSILPYFFNILFLTPNEDEIEAWNEMTKINVKHLVDELDKVPQHKKVSQQDKMSQDDKTILILQEYICYAKKTRRFMEEENGQTQTDESTKTINIFTKCFRKIIPKDQAVGLSGPV